MKPRSCLSAALLALSIASPAAGQQMPGTSALRNSATSPHLNSLPVVDEECRRTTGRQFAQWASGLVGAWVGGIVAFGIFDDPYGPGRKVKGDAGYTPNANTAFAIGSWAGSTAGVYVSGPHPRHCGSIIGTAAGSAIATIPLLFGREEPYLPVLGVLFAAPFQSLGATMMYSVRW